MLMSGKTAAQLKNNTRTRLYRTCPGCDHWNRLEEKYNLRRANGMTAYRVYWDYHDGPDARADLIRRFGTRWRQVIRRPGN